MGTICKGRLILGKCDYNGKGRRINKGEIEWELKEGEHGPTFSAMAGIWNGNGTDYQTCGQCVDEVVGLFPGNVKARRIMEVWKEWHLNDMNAGTPEQEAALKEYREKHPDERSYYTKDCEYLKSVGLYEVPITSDMRAVGGFPKDTTTYCYGTRWLYREIPADVIAEIKSW